MQGIFYAITAAALFGISTPIAKLLVGDMPPLFLAGLLYIGSGVGLAGVLALRGLYSTTSIVAWPKATEWRPLSGAIFLGGVLAPTLLMYGLRGTTASTASLLLNMESVFTALFAWFVFRENFDRRIALGMALIVIGGIALSWTAGGSTHLSISTLLIAAACLCWAADNNLTRIVSGSDAIAIACIKGLVAGSVNLLLAWMLHLTLPMHGTLIATTVAVGLLGYGVSLSLFVLALRHLGAARTGAYFSIAPFVGASIAVLIQHEALTVQLVVAALSMAIGVWLHLTEHHTHEHTHRLLEHAHTHIHDDHHRHTHEPSWDSKEPHSHFHQHTALLHRHSHYPDIHHQHKHDA